MIKRLILSLTLLSQFASASSVTTSLPTPVSIANGGTNSSTGLSNNRIIISSGSQIVEQTAQSSGRLLITDPNGFPVTTGSGALNGSLSFVTTSAQGIVGSVTNDSAAAGNVGEWIASYAAGVSAAGTGVITNVTTILITPGDWDISGGIHCAAPGGTTINSGAALIYLSLFPGTTTTDSLLGDNTLQTFIPTGSVVAAGSSVSAWRVSTAITATVYLKGKLGYSAGTPNFSGRISARRAR